MTARAAIMVVPMVEENVPRQESWLSYENLVFSLKRTSLIDRKTCYLERLMNGFVHLNTYDVSAGSLGTLAKSHF